jgi:hypothetical protein
MMNLQKSNNIPYKFNQIDINKIVYSKIKSNKDKKIILIKYENNNNLVFQTPSLLNINKGNMVNGIADIEVALLGKEESLLNNFITFLHNLENKVKQDSQKNATEWFKLKNENQSINFQKIIRETPKFSKGTLKFKILKNEDFETKVFLNENEVSSDINIKDKMWVKMLLECYAIWINSNNDFGIYLRPITISFTSKEKDNYNYNLLDDEDEEVDNIPDTEINNNIYTNINKSGFNCNNILKKLNLKSIEKNKIVEEDNIEDSVFSAVENNYVVENKINNKKVDNKIKIDNQTSSEETNYNEVDEETSVN